MSYDTTYKVSRKFIPIEIDRGGLKFVVRMRIDF